MMKRLVTVLLFMVMIASSLNPVVSYAATIAAIETYQNLATGRCLDSNTSGSVYTLGCNGGSFQKWNVIANSDGTRSFRNLATSRCLDSNTSGSVYTLGCNGGSFQRWY